MKTNIKTHRHLIAAARLLLASVLLLPALTRGAPAVQAWVQRYNGPGNSDDQAKAVAVDASNSVIVTGSSYGGGSYDDYATIQYSSAGVPLWTNLYNGPGNSDDYAIAVAVDDSNNVIVTGWSYGIGTYTDYATIEYSSVGVPLWTNRYNGPGNDYDYAAAVVVDGSNNVIVTGCSHASGYRNADYLTIQYSSAGVPLWTNLYNGPGNSDDFAIAVAVDGSNNVIVTGYSPARRSGYDYATIQYSSAGVPLWTNRFNGPGNSYDQAYAVAVDGSNNVIVAGSSATVQYSSAGVPLWTNNGYASAVAVDGSNNVIVTGVSETLKYSSAGVPLWTNLYNGPGNSDDYAIAVAVDGSNNVIVTGWSYGIGTDTDYATIQYSSAGVPLWTNRYNGPGNYDDGAAAVAVDRSGNVIVTGYSTGSGGDWDCTTIKYVSPPVMTGLTQPDGTFQLRLDNPAQAPTLVVEASTDLAAWSPVFTNATPTNVLFYTDPDASNYLWRFYRASEHW